MLNFIFIALGFLLLAFGLLGCFVYKIPGPTLSFLGILVLQFGTDIEPFTTTSLIICLFAIILCKILEKQAPKIISKFADFGKGGRIGCMIGSFAGLILIASTTNSDDEGISLPMCIVGLVIIPLILSVLGELIAKKDFNIALKAGVASWVNFFINTLLQLAVSVYCIYSSFSSFGN